VAELGCNKHIGTIGGRWLSLRCYTSPTDFDCDDDGEDGDINFDFSF